MFLEYWMVAVLFGIFAAGLFHTGRSAFHEGLEHGSEVLLAVLEREGYIKYYYSSQLNLRYVMIKVALKTFIVLAFLAISPILLLALQFAIILGVSMLDMHLTQW